MYARRLYIQLKSREKEARWFKDRTEYRIARSQRLHYKIATILVAIAMCTITITQNSISFEYCSNLAHFFGYKIEYKVYEYYQHFCNFGFILFMLLVNLNYLYIVSMVFKYCKQKRQQTNVNDKIKPIVKNFHDTLYYTRC